MGDGVQEDVLCLVERPQAAGSLPLALKRLPLAL